MLRIKDNPPGDDASSQDADEELAKKLVICRGCEPPADAKANSLWPKSAASYLTVDQVTRLFPGSTTVSGNAR